MSAIGGKADMVETTLNNNRRKFRLGLTPTVSFFVSGLLFFVGI